MYAPLRQRKNIFSRCMHLCDNGKIYFLDVCTPAATEKIHFLDVCTPAATEKIYFLDVCTPAATEKIHFFDVCTPATTEKYIFLMYALLRNEKVYSQSCKRKEECTFF